MGSPQALAGAVEDAFAQWLKPLLEEEGFEVEIMGELRFADMLVRRPDWVLEGGPRTGI